MAMVNINEITRAFAFSDTPHLILACDSPFLVMGTNPAFCTWVNSSEEMLLQQSIFSAPNKFITLTGLSDTIAIQLFKQVINLKSAYKSKIKSGFLPDKVGFNRPAGYLMEIYPILENNKVINLVLKVDLLTDLILLETVFPNYSKQEGELFTYQLLPLILHSLANVIFVCTSNHPVLSL